MEEHEQAITTKKKDPQKEEEVTMPVPKKITPTGLISSIVLLSTFLGVAFGVKETFVTKAEAAEIVVAQQARAVESDLQVINLEIQYQEDKLKNLKRQKARAPVAEVASEDSLILVEDIDQVEKRLQFLYEKRLILEKRQAELNQE
jgi:hypothetical protein